MLPIPSLRLATDSSIPLISFIAIENGSRMTGAKGNCKVKASPALKSAVKEFTEGLQKPSAFIRHRMFRPLDESLRARPAADSSSSLS
jgi:hypothetical protein